MHPAGITGCSRFTVVQRPRLRGRGEGVREAPGSGWYGWERHGRGKKKKKKSLREMKQIFKVVKVGRTDRKE